MAEQPHDTIASQPESGLAVLPEAFESDLVYALAALPDLCVCFAARATGLYRSDDGGSTWHYLYESLELEGPLPTTSVAMVPNYDGDAHRGLFAGVPGGVLRSTDGGETWFATVLDSPPPAVSALAISPDFVQDGVLLAATTEDGIFRSANRGSHWARWNFGLLDLNVYSLAISPGFADDETLFAGVESGIFRSTNGGRAWREIELPVGFEPVISIALSPVYPDDGIVLAGTETQGLLISEDRGGSWRRIGQTAIKAPVNSLLLSPGFEHRREILVLSESALLLSRDGGNTWAMVPGAPDSMTAVLAPQGISPGCPLLIGQVGGEVASIELAI
ncbi:MAG: hypothetical protein JXC32_06490 [Anaerolineae bacterium]|nr:hypothetical protein [Anaerolineae bacterium]